MIKKIKHQLMAKSRQGKYNDFISILSINSKSSILDVGVADKEFSPYDNFLEKAHPYQAQITALSIHGLQEFKQKYPNINTVTYSGGRFPFSDKQFFAVHSNAVIEHVGKDEDQLFFINEMARVSEHFFFTTPAKEFLFEIHTNYPCIHWLPKPVFDFFLKKLGKDWATGNYSHLLTKSALIRLMQRAKIQKYSIITNRIALFPYQYTVYGN